MELKPKQEMFCIEYIKDLNGKQAAVRAGYSERSAEVTASKLLRNAKVSARVGELLEKMKSEKIADDMEVLEYLTDVMRGKYKEEILKGTAEGEQVIVSIDVSAKDRLKAAELLAKRYGLLTDNVKLTGSAVVQIIDDLDGNENND